MKFYEVLKAAVEDGAKIRRSYWEDGRYYYLDEGVWLNEDGVFKSDISFTMAYMVNGDWEIYHEPMTFAQAIEAALGGATITRPGAGELAFANGKLFFDDGRKAVGVTEECARATDWRIVSEGERQMKVQGQ